MKYFKNIIGDYITSLSTKIGFINITKSEYDIIMSVIQNCPHAEGKGYRLRTDLTWEEYDVPIIEPEATEEDLLSALNRLGVSTDEESET